MLSENSLDFTIYGFTNTPKLVDKLENIKL